LNPYWRSYQLSAISFSTTWPIVHKYISSELHN
jgi:hypothetical protein